MEASRTRVRRVTLSVVLICTAVALTLPAGPEAKVTGVTFFPGLQPVLVVTGSSGDDRITVRAKSNPNTGPFYEIYDPDGVDVVPPGCSREDANTIRCPAQGISIVTLAGDAGNDTLVFDIPPGVVDQFDPFFSALGGGGDDVIQGTGFADTQNGGPGDDEQFGGGGNDKQIGGPGDDTQSGQAGNDTQLGGPGNDVQKGGSGKDTQNCGAGDNDKGVGGGGKDKSKGCEKGKP